MSTTPLGGPGTSGTSGTGGTTPSDRTGGSTSSKTSSTAKSAAKSASTIVEKSLRPLIANAQMLNVISEVMTLLIKCTGTMQKLALTQSELQKLPLKMQEFYIGVGSKLLPVSGFDPSMKGSDADKSAALSTANQTIAAQRETVSGRAAMWNDQAKQLSAAVEATSQIMSGFSSIFSSTLQVVNTIMSSLVKQ